MPTPSKSFGDRIRLLRMQRGLKQKDLADHLNLARSTISNWENDRRLPSLEELRSLADYFQLSLNDFVDSTIQDAPQTQQATTSFRMRSRGFSSSLVDHVFLGSATATLFFSLWLTGVYRLFFSIFGSMALLLAGTHVIVKSLRAPQEMVLLPKDEDDSSSFNLNLDTSKQRLFKTLITITCALLFVIASTVYTLLFMKMNRTLDIGGTLWFLLMAMLAFYLGFNRLLGVIRHHPIPTRLAIPREVTRLSTGVYSWPLFGDFALLILTALVFTLRHADFLTRVSDITLLVLWAVHMLSSFALLTWVKHIHLLYHLNQD